MVCLPALVHWPERRIPRAAWTAWTSLLLAKRPPRSLKIVLLWFAMWTKFSFIRSGLRVGNFCMALRQQASTELLASVDATAHSDYNLAEACDPGFMSVHEVAQRLNNRRGQIFTREFLRALEDRQVSI